MVELLEQMSALVHSLERVRQSPLPPAEGRRVEDAIITCLASGLSCAVHRLKAGEATERQIASGSSPSPDGRPMLRLAE